ncbi:MAG: hypothetical protein E7351_00615 [Clostridiales bacterium]|nr:hypothetical protein [Clostridiales bacterium]
MHEYWHVTLEALIHTAQILPLLFIVYYLIELFEFKCAHKMQSSKFLKGKASPVFGSLLGCVPQCGFSVVSTDLYSRGIISVGALIAVYIATSDEAIPLMLSNPASIGWMFALIGVKIVLGISVGFLAIVLHKALFKKKEIHDHEEHEHHDHDHEESEAVVHGGCCHHNVETKSFDWLHPLLHCLKISAFILIINILFGFITHIWVGEDRLIAFLSQSRAFQPVLAILIGLIPNCASSVALTELFLLGGLSFGALVAGLSVNAGLGLIILLKQNKNWKENLFIICMLVIPSLIVGYALNFI